MKIFWHLQDVGAEQVSPVEFPPPLPTHLGHREGKGWEGGRQGWERTGRQGQGRDQNGGAGDGRRQTGILMVVPTAGLFLLTCTACEAGGVRPLHRRLVRLGELEGTQDLSPRV